MKTKCLLLALALLSATIASAQRPSDTLATAKETPVPREWQVPAGNAPNIKRRWEQVPELDTARYFLWAGFADSETRTQLFMPTETRAPQQCRIVVFFDKDAVWANQLRANQLRIESEEFQSEINRFHLRLQTYFEAGEDRDGLVFSVEHPDVPVVQAGKTLSGLPAVRWVSLYTPR
jgi:hypothetical protein